MKTLIVVSAMLMLAGCASSGDYKQYVAAQQEANRLATDAQKPLVRLTAQPGQAITGLASLEVYTPTAAPVIQQARPNEWVGVLGQGLGIIGTVASLKVSGDAAIGLADSVGKWSTAGYSSVQAPAANVSTVTTTTSTDASNRSVTTTDASNRSVTTTDSSNRAVSSVGDNSGSNSGNSGRIAGTTMSDATSTPTVVTQPAPVVVQSVTTP